MICVEERIGNLVGGLAGSSSITILIFFLALCAPGLGSDSECARTANMRIYSDAYLSEETGDVTGAELAIKQKANATVDALLFVYEGAPNNDGIPISGRISGGKLTLEGTWVEHLIEYPSKKEIIQTHSVKIVGTLDAASFLGSIEIGGLSASNDEKLKRVNKIWLCK
jgi:hypothetical protein